VVQKLLSLPAFLRDLSSSRSTRFHGLLGALLLAIATTWVSTLAAPVYAQSLEAVAVAERERDFGRLTLRFRDRLDLPPYQLDAENGVMRIVFEEAVDTDIRDAMRVLSDFVTIARRDPDGRALRFGLSRAVRINTMEAGETLFIDFLPTTWQGFPPPLPEEVVTRLAERAEQAAREAAEAERRRLLGELEPEVTLRVGAAPTFTRYAFNWNVPFNVAVAQSGPELTMEFDYDVPIDLSQAFIDQPSELVNLDYNRDGASLSITMEVAPGSGLRWFEDDQRFVVDLERETPLDMDGVDQEELDRVMATLSPAIDGVTDDTTRFSAVAARTDDVVEPQDDAQVVDATRPLDPNSLALIDSEPDVGMANDPAPMGEGGLADSEAAPLANVPLLSDGTPAITEEDLEILAQRPDVVTARALQGGRAPEVGEAMEEAVDPNIVRVEVRMEGDETRLLFPFSQPTPAAAFRRESFVTLVFQNPIPFDLRAMRLELNDLVRSIRPVRVNDLNLIHLEMRGSALVSMVPSGDRWIVVLGPSIVEPPQGLEVGRGTLPDGKAFAEVLGEGFGRMRRIIHPHVGDELLVVPMLAPSQGGLSRQELVEFEILPSAQGLVVRPKSDALALDVERNRVVITREQGLTLSEVGLSLGSFGFSPDERPGYFDLRAYAREGASGFRDRYEDFQESVATAEGAVRIERLMAFARFLLAFNLAQEANGILDIAVSEASALEHDEAYLMVRAAALTLAERSDEALAIIDSHVMDGVADAGFWGLLANASQRDWPAVNAAYDDVAVLFDGYPSGLVAQARLDGVEAALNVQAIDLATERLSQIDPTRLLGSPMEDRLTLLQGQIELAKGRMEEALEVFDNIRAENEGPLGAQATLLGIETRVLNEELTLAEGLDQLENLAVAWRGDDTEVRTRRFLGELYVEQGRYSDALKALKGILIAQPDHSEADDVSDDMQAIFVDLYLDGEADQMPVIDALSLFYDFRELTPIGRRGDELVRRLVDRLVSIDLLDQAADLLLHQVENRLTGTAKAQIAADLALIYLMDYRPSEAVAVLQRSRVSQAPQSIERGRRVIEARALSELGRHELALEMLRNLDGNDIDAVRADVLWNAERWTEAGEVLERSLADRWRDRVPLDEEEMQQVLRASIAFSFANDEYALERLRARFDGKMSDGIYASAFDVVTAPIETQGSAFRDVARGIAGLNTLNRFLDDYRSTFSSQTTPIASPGA
jgi:tetratricopeptide (TPR) repeat protein